MKHFLKFWWAYLLGIIAIVIIILLVKKSKEVAKAPTSTTPTGTSTSTGGLVCTLPLNMTKKMFFGDVNCEVKRMQELINQTTISPKLIEDGVFGSNTKNALIQLGYTQTMLNYGVSLNDAPSWVGI